MLHSLQTGGLETLALEFCVYAQARAANELEMYVCGLEAGDGLERQTRYRGVPCRSLADRAPGWMTPLILSRLEAYLRELRPDVIHAHNYRPLINAAFARARVARSSRHSRNRPALILTKHGAHRPRVLGSRGLAGYLLRRADALVAVSPEARGVLAEICRVPLEKTRLIFNGIDALRFQPRPVPAAAREAERLRLLGVAGNPLVGAVCRLKSYKGVNTLLAAFAELRRHEPGATLAIIGGGPDAEVFAETARNLGVAPYTRFLGRRAELENIYPLFDIFALASYTEGISLTVLEAAACGLPLVLTRAGGNPEIITHESNGLLVHPRDVNELAAALLLLWRDRALAARLGAAARERVVSAFSLERMAGDYLALYRELTQTAQ